MAGEPDPTSAGTSPADDLAAISRPAGAEGPEPGQEGVEHLSLAQVAQQQAERLVSETGGSPAPAPAQPAGAQPGQPPAAGAQPAGAQPSQPPAAGAQPAEGDPVSAMQQALQQLPPDLQAGFQGPLEQIQAWTQQVEQYVGGLQGQYQQVQAFRERLEQIAANPVFQQALAQVKATGGATGGAAGGAPGNGAPPGTQGGPRAAEGLTPLPAMQQFETVAEEALYRHAQERDAVLQRMHGQVEQLTAFATEAASRLRGQEAAEQRREMDGLSQTIASIHAELDRQFPALAQDEASKQRWHQTAAALLIGHRVQAQEAGRIPQDNPPPYSAEEIKASLLQAAQALGYEAAYQEGGKAALGRARKAARGSTIPERHTRTPASPGVDPNLSLAELAERMAG